MSSRARKRAKKRLVLFEEMIPEKFKELPVKEFVLRNSVLTDMFDKVPEIKTIHHIFVAILICLGLSTIAHDHFIKKEIHFGLTLIFSGFRKFHVVITSWVVLMLMNFSCYIYFIFWAETRCILPSKSLFCKTWDCFWLMICILYHVACFYLAAFFVHVYHLPPPSACFVLLEQIRLSMKAHAFVRSSAEEVIRYEPHSGQNEAVPKFKHYLYFLFAPTCIYRNEYPRTKEIRWKFIFHRILEIAGVIVCLSFIFHRFFIPAYKDFGIRRFTWNELIVSFLEHSLPALLVYVCGFYLLLHSLQNIFAELLFFGDRLFYRDWWNCRTFTAFFKTWNIVVHDWLYMYLYRDIYEHVIRNKAVAKIITFLVSAVVHEWALVNMFGYFFPGVFIFFMIFVLIIFFVKIPNGTVVNILFWLGLALGCGFLVSGYTLEYFARNNLLAGDGSLKDRLLPKWLTCDCIY